MNRRSWFSAALASVMGLFGLKPLFCAEIDEKSQRILQVHGPLIQTPTIKQIVESIDYTPLCDYIAWDICKGIKSDSIPNISSYLQTLVSEFRKNHTQEECNQYLWEYHHFLRGDWPTPIPPELAPHAVLKKFQSGITNEI